jgi:hypothetical protein
MRWHPACVILFQVCGLDRARLSPEFDHLARLVAENPFAAHGPALGSVAAFRPGVSRAIRRRSSPPPQLHGLRLGSGEAFSVTRVVNGKPGYPTPVLEAALGVPATTRAWRTIERLVSRHA